MKVDFNQILMFIGRWAAIGIVLHFGLKLGEMLDRIIPAI